MPFAAQLPQRMHGTHSPDTYVPCTLVTDLHLAVSHTAGPTISPSDAVTCTPLNAAPLTDGAGIASWSCVTGPTGTNVTISVTAPHPSGEAGPWHTLLPLHTSKPSLAQPGFACHSSYVQASSSTVHVLVGNNGSRERDTEPSWHAAPVQFVNNPALHHSVCCTAVCGPAGDTVSDSVAFTVGTDCVGDFTPFGTCSNVCGQGEYSRTFNVVSVALEPFRAWLFKTFTTMLSTLPAYKDAFSCLPATIHVLHGRGVVHASGPCIIPVKQYNRPLRGPSVL